ncbi:DUF3267 domain-containing protein [Natrarchaeobius chitinivorans]|uniref:DUF3267 domain-containing protein n=1 Tax=Natrarchaeobius chitinivorans TaxID=1679083 RepID=A0A3N6NEN1_NATCH|nr:DUF3267 domain-containing protein [Natrarchaeobius chitinivorans]RQG97342.1 DUF3267 domain-containing protein [Natrarchaeobius chitinivorans]
MHRQDRETDPHLVATFRLTRAVAAQRLVVSVVAFFAFAYGFGYVLATRRGRALEPIVIAPASLESAGLSVLAAIVLVGFVVVAHEAVHGIAMARYGGSPRYGVGVSHFLLPDAYAETDGTTYSRREMLAILLAPFVTITTAGLVAMAIYPTPLLLAPLAVNAAGSVGDLWMAVTLCRYSDDVRVSGLPDGGQGFGIYASSERPIDRHPGVSILSSMMTGTVWTFVVVGTSVLAVVLLSLAFASGNVVVGDPDGWWFLVRHEVRAGGGAILEIGTPFVAALSLGGGVLWTVLVTAVRRTA